MHSRKLLHGWLLVMHMHDNTAGVMVCPGCGAHSETIDHLYQCPNTLMHKVREDSFLLCQRLDLPLDFFIAIMEYVQASLLGEHPPNA
jgi:hypothetical protein